MILYNNPVTKKEQESCTILHTSISISSISSNLPHAIHTLAPLGPCSVCLGGDWSWWPVPICCCNWHKADRRFTQERYRHPPAPIQTPPRHQYRHPPSTNTDIPPAPIQTPPWYRLEQPPGINNHSPRNSHSMQKQSTPSVRRAPVFVRVKSLGRGKTESSTKQ